MAKTPSGPIDTILYRAALYLHPPAFREEYAREMALDFSAGRREARAFGRRSLWRFWVQMAADLGQSVLMQWLRTGLPHIFVAAGSCSISLILALICFWRASVTFPIGVGNFDAMLLTLLSTVLVLVIAAAMIFTTWFTRTTRARRQF